MTRTSLSMLFGIAAASVWMPGGVHADLGASKQVRAATCEAPAGVASEPLSSTDPSLAITLSGPATRRVDEAIPLSLVFHNRSAAPITVMRALDGSESHWRRPYYDVFAENLETHAIEHPLPGGRCGMVNAIGEADYVTLAPNSSQADIPGGFAHFLNTFSLSQPGRYRIWVVYRYCANDASNQGMRMGTDVEHPSWVGEVASSAIEVEVSAAPQVRRRRARR